MKKLSQLLFGILITSVMISCNTQKKEKQEEKSSSEETTATIVTEDNFPQAYTNLRLQGVLKKAGVVNKFFEMPLAPSIPENQFVVRMNRDTWYSIAIVDMTSDNVYVTIPESDQYLSMQVVDENNQTDPMIYGGGKI
jgi:hypothetical protein